MGHCIDGVHLDAHVCPAPISVFLRVHTAMPTLLRLYFCVVDSLVFSKVGLLFYVLTVLCYCLVIWVNGFLSFGYLGVRCIRGLRRYGTAGFGQSQNVALGPGVFGHVEILSHVSLDDHGLYELLVWRVLISGGRSARKT